MRETGAELVPGYRAAATFRGVRFGPVLRSECQFTGVLAAVVRNERTSRRALAGTSVRAG